MTSRDARAIELMKAVPGFRNQTLRREFEVDGSRCVVTEIHHGLRYQTVRSGRCPTYPVSYRVEWIGSSISKREESVMSVTNTTRQVNDDPMGMLVSAMAFGGSGAIENQEAQGQRELAASDVLPSNGIDRVRPMLEANGGSVGVLVDGDPMFINVTLPAGWSKRPTEHSMHTDLVDDKGRKRASIFYKAAFYDRSASISPTKRFDIDAYSHNVTGEIKVSIRDASGEFTWESDVVKVSDSWSEKSAAREKLEKEATAILVAKYPQWEDANAYWDEVKAAA